MGIKLGDNTNEKALICVFTILEFKILSIAKKYLQMGRKCDRRRQHKEQQQRMKKDS